MHRTHDSKLHALRGLSAAQGRLRRTAQRLRGANSQAGLAELDAFEAKHAQRYAAIASSWGGNWERVRPFFDSPADLRRLIYTTNAIESLNFQLRKVTKGKGHFPTDEAVTKLLHLALRNAERKWTNGSSLLEPCPEPTRDPFSRKALSARFKLTLTRKF